MSTCLNCDRAPEEGRVFCSMHSGQGDAPQRSSPRIFLTSMVITLIIGAVIFGCFLGVQLIHLR